MEIRVLKYFITVAQEENMTRAAEVLHTTQSNLSRQLAELENSVGKKLFERGSRKITLTFGAACFSGRYRADSSSENTAPETLYLPGLSKLPNSRIRMTVRGGSEQDAPGGSAIKSACGYSQSNSPPQNSA